MKLARTVAVLALGLVLVAACTTHPLGSSSTSAKSPSSSPSPVVTIPVVSPAPPVTAGFDPARVVQVLGPAVAELIVTTSGGGGIGTGFVIARENGTSYLVTNNHVVAGQTRVVVLMPDGRHFTATVQGTDPIQDIACDGVLRHVEYVAMQ